jgi:hypothetical protein
MAVITILFVSGVVGLVCYQIGRARRLNQAIRDNPDKVLVNRETGEVVEPHTPEWNAAMRQGNVVTFL